MKRRVKVYLDTSVISALFDEGNPQRKALTKAFFKEIENFEAYISEITVAEIERTSDSGLQNKMRETMSGFSIPSLTDDLEWLAKEHVRYGVVPEGYPEDAYHVAIAVINEMNYLLSWNFIHLVRRKAKDIARIVNTLDGIFREG